MSISFRFPPHKKQLEWINPMAREKLFGGAKRGVKSAALAMHIVLLSLGFPGNRGLLARKNMTDLIDSTLFEFEHIVPKEIYEHRRHDRMVTFPNGSSFIYRGLGEESEFVKEKSVTVGWFEVDERSEIHEATFSEIKDKLTRDVTSG